MKLLNTTLRSGLVALLAALILVPTASAAAPVAETLAPKDIGPGSVTLRGRVDPNGEATRFYFEYGTTRRYGSRTADVAAGNGQNRRGVEAAVGGLAPNTTYHYRLVASNASGVDSGANRTFRTKPQPLGLQITAAPNPVIFGSASSIAGVLTGTGNGGKQVILQQRPFPFTADWANVGNPVVTDANGAFAFAILPLPSTTQFRVRTAQQPQVTSDELTLGVAPLVRTSRSRTSVRRNRRVTFHGTIRPSRVGIPFELQKQTKRGQWVVVGRGLTRKGRDDTYARYSERTRLFRSAKYRVFVNTGGGDLVSGFGPELTVRVKRG